MNMVRKLTDSETKSNLELFNKRHLNDLKRKYARIIGNSYITKDGRVARIGRIKGNDVYVDYFDELWGCETYPLTTFDELFDDFTMAKYVLRLSISSNGCERYSPNLQCGSVIIPFDSLLKLSKSLSDLTMGQVIINPDFLKSWFLNNEGHGLILSKKLKVLGAAVAMVNARINLGDNWL